MEPAATDIAWAAGFIDGEGSLYLSRTGRKTSYTRTPMLKATQVEREPLDQLVRIFGGRVMARNRRTSTGKIAYDWVLSGGDQIRRVLPQLIPFLVVKKEAAKIVLEYAQAMRPSSGPGSGSYALRPEELEKRIELIAALAATRDRGKTLLQMAHQ